MADMRIARAGPALLRAAALCAALGLSSVGAGVGAATGTSGKDPLLASVDALFAPWSRADSPGCAATVTRSGRQVYRRGFGMASLEQERPITPRTIFYIASTSKQFTAAAVALLAAQGRLSLDDDVRRHVPELPDYGHRMTVSHLVHHTSGLRDYLSLAWMAGRDEADSFPRAEALRIIARQRATLFPPGTAFRYSNTNYLLLSLIVERASGQSLGEFARQHIFQPLGMEHTQFYEDSTLPVRGRAASHTGNSRDGWRLKRSSFALVGDGGLLTTIDDLALWERNFLDNRLAGGGQALIRQLTTPGRLDDGTPLEYGFGLTMSRYRGLATVSHSGSFLAYQADMLRFPTQRLAIFVLCNHQDAQPWKISREIADLYLDREFTGPAPRPPAPASTPTSPPASAGLARELAGVYASDDLQATYTVAAEGDGLRVRTGDTASWHWTLTGPDMADWDDDAVRFTRGPGGGIDGFVMAGGPGQGMRFSRR